MTTRNILRLKHVCVSASMSACSSGTFAHWMALGLFLQGPHKQGKDILLTTGISHAGSGCCKAMLFYQSIYEYLCIKLPHHRLRYTYKWVHTFCAASFSFLGRGLDFGESAGPRSSVPPPHTHTLSFRVVPASLLVLISTIQCDRFTRGLHRMVGKSCKSFLQPYLAHFGGGAPSRVARAA